MDAWHTCWDTCCWGAAVVGSTLTISLPKSTWVSVAQEFRMSFQGRRRDAQD